MSLIDVIVGVKNEEKYIKRCITSLQNQTIHDINIIVVDGLSIDRTPEIVEEIAETDSRVKLLKNPHEVISSARNIGLKASDSEYVAYLDGHGYVDNDWLETLHKAFETYYDKCKLAGVGSTYSSPRMTHFSVKSLLTHSKLSSVDSEHLTQPVRRSFRWKQLPLLFTNVHSG
jgi:glycosyltransferase involved in cell wall biosynthesis